MTAKDWERILLKMAHLNVDPSSKERWIIVYPAFLNSRRTVVQGRRVPKAKAADNPTVYEIRDVCQSQGLNVEIENKYYPKDSCKDSLCKGRVRVQLRDSSGKPVNQKFESRQSLFLFVGEMIPKLKSRQSKTGQADSGSQQQGAAAKKKKGKKGKQGR